MGSKSQRKGAAGEQELAQILREYGYSCDRGGSLSFGEVADITGLPGIHIEVKRVEKLNVCEAMEQSIRDSERMDDGMPVLFHRRNRRPWLVTMRLEDWMRMYQK
jgi:Holliday junction resolvase